MRCLGLRKGRIFRRKPKPTNHSLDVAIEVLHMVFSRGDEGGIDASKNCGLRFGSKAAGDFLLHFHHRTSRSAWLLDQRDCGSFRKSSVSSRRSRSRSSSLRPPDPDPKRSGEEWNENEPPTGSGEDQGLKVERASGSGGGCPKFNYRCFQRVRRRSVATWPAGANRRRWFTFTGTCRFSRTVRTMWRVSGCSPA